MALYMTGKETERYAHPAQRTYNRVKQAFDSSKLRDARKIEESLGCEPTNLLKNTAGYKPSIIHFTGHGAEDAPGFQVEYG